MAKCFDKGATIMLGDIFREEREKKKISLHDVENETNIRASYLEAIEKGNYDVIRGEVYLKGFIKAYAKFLGLDYKEMLQKYHEEKATSAPEPVTIEDTAKESLHTEQQAPPKVSANTSTLHKFSETRKKNNNTINIIFIALVAIIVIGCVAYFVVPLFTAPKVAKQVNVPAVATQQQESAAQPEQKNNGVHVEATFTDKCWTQVKVDGQTVVEKTVPRGSSLKWDGSQEIEIVAGNAKAVQVKYNGKDLGALGNSGAVITKKFTQNNVEDVKQ